MVEHFLRQSLENLGLDHVDLYLVYNPTGLKVSKPGMGPRIDLYIMHNPIGL